MYHLNRNLSSDGATLPPLDPSLNGRGPLRSRLSRLWESPDQHNLRRRITSAHPGQIEFCVQAEAGQPLLYALREFVDALEREKGNAPLLCDALEAAVSAHTWMRPSSDLNAVEFYFPKDGIHFRVKLNYKPVRFQTTTFGDMITEGTISGIRIEGPDVYQREDRERGEGASRSASGHLGQKQLVGPYSLNMPRNGGQQNGSARFLLWINHGKHGAYVANPSEPNLQLPSGSTTRAGFEPNAITAESSYGAASCSNVNSASTGSGSDAAVVSTSGKDKTVFDVIKNEADLPRLMVHQPGVEAILNQFPNDESALYNALFPPPPFAPGTSEHEKRKVKKARYEDLRQLKKFKQLLNVRDPSQTLAQGLANLKAFGDNKEALFDQNPCLGGSSMNRLRQRVFYLSSSEIIAMLDPCDDQVLKDQLLNAGLVDESLARMNTSIAELIVGKDKGRFAVYKKTICDSNPKNRNLRSVLNTLEKECFKKPPTSGQGNVS